jgi:hypothetical protein
VDGVPSLSSILVTSTIVKVLPWEQLVIGVQVPGVATVVHTDAVYPLGMMCTHYKGYNTSITVKMVGVGAHYFFNQIEESIMNGLGSRSSRKEFCSLKRKLD